MTDYQKALDAAREAHMLGDMVKCDRELGDLLAAIDAQKPVAWIVPEDIERMEPGYALRTSLSSSNINGELVPLYAAPPAVTVPEGYALIGIDALRAWGRLDEVRDACLYPLAAAQAKESTNG